MIATTTDPLPGIYPFITHRDPSLTGNGCDNLGMGFTEHGEQFMLKDGGALGVAEFVGARVADACGVPACQPTVVTIETWNGPRHVFGSRIESGRHMFDQSDVDSWQKVMAQCNNATAFSAMLAIDLVLGNDDRHWNNWIVQKATDASGKPCLRLRALDFSRSWPVRHPAQHPLRHAGPNTWPPPKTGPCWAFRSTLLFFTPPVQKSVASMPSGCAARSWTQSRESFFRPAKSMPTALGGSNA